MREHYDLNPKPQGFWSRFFTRSKAADEALPMPVRIWRNILGMFLL
jgi:hypothetical protein